MLEIAIKDYFKKEPFSYNSEHKKLKDLEGDILLDTYELDESSEMVYTAVLMKRYKTIYHEAEFCFVIGSDLLISLKNFHNYDSLKNETFLIFKRTGYSLDEKSLPTYSTLLNDNINNAISSTMIR